MSAPSLRFPCLLVLTAALFPACGRNALLSEGTPGALPATGFPFAPTEGCRNGSQPGCSQCCRAVVDEYGVEGCSIEGVNWSKFASGPCPTTCPPCAVCMTATEEVLTSRAANPRPDCDCPTVDTGIDPCMALGSCECFCSSLQLSLSMCPQLAAATCSHGNHCGTMLLAAPGPYALGEELAALWVNFDTRTAFLGACGGLDIQRWQGTAYVTVSQAAGCPSTSAESALAYGQSRRMTLTIPTDLGGGRFRLQGTYYWDCAGGTAVGPATCTGPIGAHVDVGINAQ
jgi:hypothetical protein